MSETPASTPGMTLPGGASRERLAVAPTSTPSPECAMIEHRDTEASHGDRARAARDSFYESRRATAVTERDRRQRQSTRWSIARAAIVSFALAAWWATSSAGWLRPSQGWALAGLALVAFIAAITLHDRVERARAMAAARIAVCDEAGARIVRRWDDMPVAGAAPAGRTDATAHDLDLSGRASLRQLIGPTATPGGDALVSTWIEAASCGEISPSTVVERQRAVRELAALADVRLAFSALAKAGRPLDSAPLSDVLDWLEGADTPLTSAAIVALAWGVPVSIAAVVAGVVPAAAAGPILLAAPVVAWGARFALARHVGRAFAASNRLADEGSRYAGLFGACEALTPASPRLAALVARVAAPAARASTEFSRLARRIDTANLRHSHLPHALIHSVTAWDLHAAAALERWKRQNRPHVREWFEALAEIDALATLGGLAFDEPGWCTPDVVEGADRIDATAIAHPLLAASTRVSNDVVVGPAGTSLVITGSNMSGKSTLLRAIGTNVVLAQLGAPVCAARFAMPPTRLATSLHISDSLADGVSYFMAALRRLKAVVDLADRATPAGPVVCYLLDEVLQGTNSEERQVAVRRVFTHLVSTRAIGAITTHDLNLVHTPEFAGHARHVHFSEYVDEREGACTVRFDYQLRPGPATSRNALALMRMVGLD